MINIYKLANLLEAGMSLSQFNKWKTEGIWFPVIKYNRESPEIQVITNLFFEKPEDEPYFINLFGNYDEFDTWIEFLEKYQWKLYPLLAELLKFFLENPKEYRLSFTMNPEIGFLSVTAKKLNNNENKE